MPPPNLFSQRCALTNAHCAYHSSTWHAAVLHTSAWRADGVPGRTAAHRRTGLYCRRGCRACTRHLWRHLLFRALAAYQQWGGARRRTATYNALKRVYTRAACTAPTCTGLRIALRTLTSLASATPNRTARARRVLPAHTIRRITAAMLPAHPPTYQHFRQHWRPVRDGTCVYRAALLSALLIGGRAACLSGDRRGHGLFNKRAPLQPATPPYCGVKHWMTGFAHYATNARISRARYHGKPRRSAAGTL